MPWVRFLENFDYTPAERRQVTYAYLAGRADRVTRECARQAVTERRVAVVIKTPKTRAQAQALRESIVTNPVRRETADGVDTAP